MLRAVPAVDGVARSPARPGGGARHAVCDSRTIDEIGRVVDAEAIDCGFTKRGTINAAAATATGGCSAVVVGTPI